ncbi:endonuclease III [Natrinema sp. 1APR25-10V2]|uniref:endonuclease III domain-containing protein n=1 Tax=Natrinema sp. 1APR25-10V2 TaxID=2951081 RepID=UPI002876618B|nr:endonuclease III [Natrinema sp. 1APR25-10V2]MDS0474902.1 endonuclease III [Natrinema sp. 1APR25-10V2]
MTRAERVVDRLWDLYAETYSPCPSENIGVAPEQDTSITDIDSQRDYWQKTYGGQDAFICLVRTILSQNTSDKASQPAHDALLERYTESDSHGDAHGAGGQPRANDVDLAESLANAEQSTLAETISSAGLYNQKSEIIIDTAAWVLERFGSAAAFDAFVTDEDPETVRDTLLEVRGVGPKTADCVLLFSGGRGGVFPVDTHVHRIYRRMGIAPPAADHEGVRAVLERDVPAAECGFGRQEIAKRYNGDCQSDEHEFHNGGTYVVDGEEITFAHGGVPPEKCGFGHTATIQFGREYCTARKPACLEGPEACPLFDLCDRVGVDIESGTVVDPAETVSNDEE